MERKPLSERSHPRYRSTMGLTNLGVPLEGEAPPPPRKETILVRLCIFLPLFLAGIATTLFYLQGGYGHGELAHDLAIHRLCLPGSLLIPDLPKCGVAILDLVWVPAVINSFILGCFGLLVQVLRPHTKVSV